MSNSVLSRQISCRSLSVSLLESVVHCCMSNSVLSRQISCRSLSVSCWSLPSAVVTSSKYAARMSPASSTGGPTRPRTPPAVEVPFKPARVILQVRPAGRSGESGGGGGRGRGGGVSCEVQRLTEKWWDTGHWIATSVATRHLIVRQCTAQDRMDRYRTAKAELIVCLGPVSIL